MKIMILIPEDEILLKIALGNFRARAAFWSKSVF